MSVWEWYFIIAVVLWWYFYLLSIEEYEETKRNQEDLAEYQELLSKTEFLLSRIGLSISGVENIFFPTVMSLLWPIFMFMEIIRGVKFIFRLVKG